MRAISTYGLDVSARAYASDESGRMVTTPPMARLAVHEYYADDDGRLVHVIDGVIRALVPASSARAYAEAWPDCAPVVDDVIAADQLRAGDVRLAPPAPGASSETAATSEALSDPADQTAAADPARIAGDPGQTASQPTEAAPAGEVSQ